MINTFFFQGVVFTEPEEKFSMGGEPYLIVRLRGKKNHRSKSPFVFERFVAVGQVAENIKKYVKVGQTIIVEGMFESYPITLNGNKYIENTHKIVKVMFDHCQDEILPADECERIRHEFIKKNEGFDENGGFGVGEQED